MATPDRTPDQENGSSRSYAGPWLVAVVVGLTVVIGGTMVVNIQAKEIEARRALELVSTGSALRARLSRGLNSALYLSSGLSSYLAVRRGNLQRSEVEAILEGLYNESENVRNFSIAVGYRVTYTYPVRGNEKIIGLYYPEVADQWPAVKRVIESGLPVLVGPIRLIQGGNGLIYRVPIYVKGRYWGLLSSVIDSDALLKTALSEVSTEDIALAIRGKDAAGMRGAVFHGDAALFDHPDARLVDIEVPGGKWVMALRSTTTSPLQRAVWLLYGLVWILALTLGWGTLTALTQRAQLAQLALFDPLTALPNRRLLRDRIGHALTGLHRNPSQTCMLLFIDLDGFKLINDRYGHKAGDIMLQGIARRLNDSVRENDSVGRWGGDEFVVFMEDIDRSGTGEIINKLREAVETPLSHEGHELKVGASIGCVHAPGDGATLDELVRAADTLMYSEKARRKSARAA